MNYKDKIFNESSSDYIEIIRKWKSEKNKIVFTNGCFDILHSGHIMYLNEAKKLGDKLVIGLNSDESVRRLKGEYRPVKSEDCRADILAFMGEIDLVLIFNDDTPYELIKKLLPDVLVKGGDWDIQNIVGADIVIDNGGVVKSLNFLEGHSTTTILKKIAEGQKELMKLIEITDYLESFAPLQYQESYDNSGFLIGDIGAEFRGAVISLDVTESVVDECISLGYNLIISHHPIIFKGLKKITGDNYVERTVAKAIKNDIAIYAIHTNLDNAFREGVSARLAMQLDIEITNILKPMNSSSSAEYGAGVIGLTKKKYKESGFLNFIKQKLGLKCLKYTSLLGKDISKVALCGGSGSFLIDEAINQEADIFISADFKYHDFFDSDGKMILVDIGHYESEIYTINLIYDKLKNNFSNFAAHLTKVITNPINYL